MLSFIRAGLSSDWCLSADRLRATVLNLFAFDRKNYALWLSIYPTSMINLQDQDRAPDVHQQFRDGNFSLNCSGEKIAGVSMDQVLEQTLSRDNITCGGLAKISNNKEARSKWFLTSHIRGPDVEGLKRAM